MLDLAPPHRRDATPGGPDNVLIYFERISDGRLIVPPVAHAPTPVCRLPKPHQMGSANCLCGYVRREVRGWRELEKISKRYELQRQCDFEVIDEAHYKRVQAKMEELRSRIRYAMANARSNRVRDTLRYVLKRLEDGEKRWAPRKIEAHFHIEEG